MRQLKMCNSMKIFIVLIICCTSSTFCFSQNVKTKQGLSIKIDTIGVFREGPNNLRVFNVHLTLQNTTSKNALLWFDKCEISDSLSFRNKFILINGDFSISQIMYDQNLFLVGGTNEFANISTTFYKFLKPNELFNIYLIFRKTYILHNLIKRIKFISSNDCKYINEDCTRFSYGYDELVLDEKNIKP